MRESFLGPRSDAPESVTEPRENLSTGSGGTVRRFFPFPRTQRYASVTNPPWTLSDSPDSEEAGPMRFGSTPYFTDSTGLWHPNTSSDAPRAVSPDADNRDDTEPLPRAPRLRLPMSVRNAAQDTFSRHASPVAGNLIPVGSLPTATDPVESTDTPVVPPSSPRRDQDASIPTDEAVAYPTPGSTENENTA